MRCIKPNLDAPGAAEWLVRMKARASFKDSVMSRAYEAFPAEAADVRLAVAFATRKPYLIT